MLLSAFDEVRKNSNAMPYHGTYCTEVFVGNASIRRVRNRKSRTEEEEGPFGRYALGKIVLYL